MKRVLTLILVLSLVALVGCGTAGKTSSEVDKEVASQSETDTESNQASNISDKVKAGTVELCDYKKLKVDWTTSTNSAILDNYLSEYTATTKEIKDRAVKNGDVANIDFAGYKDGKAFDGGTSLDYDLEIGSGSFIPGFEEGLVGVMPGETVNLDLTFPESYQSADLAGKDVVFKVTVNFIKEETFSEEDLNSAKKAAYGQAVLNEIMTNSTYGKLDADLTKFYTDKYTSMYESQIKTSYGYESIEAYLEATGSKREDFDAMVKGNAEYRVMYDTAVNTIAEKENIKVTDAEYKKYVEQYAKASGMSAEEFENQNGKTLIVSQLVAERVTAALQEK